jgi:hypothetical protein
MAKQLTVERGLAIASCLSLLPPNKLPTTTSHGYTTTCLENIQQSLKEGDKDLWVGVSPTTIDGWIRKVESLSEHYKTQDLNKNYTGIDKSHFKGDWNVSTVCDMSRYLLKIGETITTAKQDKIAKLELKRHEKAQQFERKRAIESTSLKTGKKVVTLTSSKVDVTYIYLLCFLTVVVFDAGNNERS